MLAIRLFESLCKQKSEQAVDWDSLFAVEQTSLSTCEILLRMDEGENDSDASSRFQISYSHPIEAEDFGVPAPERPACQDR